MNISRPLAPEDLEPGQYVCILHQMEEIPPWVMNGEETLRTGVPPKVMRLPDSTLPIKIVDVCLPYVFGEWPGGKHRTLDVRRYRFALVSERFARQIFEQVSLEKEREKEREKLEGKKE